MTHKITDLFRRLIPSQKGKIQTFTYYVPAPPPRKSGYREKDFDKLCFHFINRGFNILEIKTLTANAD